MHLPSVNIVLLNWNGWNDTIECLESLLHLDYPSYKIIVCDNASSDGSMDKIIGWAEGQISVTSSEQSALSHLTPVRKMCRQDYCVIDNKSGKEFHSPQPFLTLIQTGSNLGFAGGNNVGLQFALDQGAEYCWLLNNDTIVEPNSLSEMVRHSEELSAKGIKNTCGSVQCFYDDPSVVQALGGFSFNPWSGIASETFGRYMKINSNINHQDFQQRLDAIHGCSWLLSRQFLTEIGLMEEQYFLFYEEIDWCLRCKDSYLLTYAPKAIVYHKEGSSIGYNKTKKNSLMSEFYSQRNKYLLADKFFPHSKPTITIAMLMQAAKKLFRLDFALFGMDLKVALGKRSI